jgi:APA family basic amino acid/polyamine antiporter
VAVGIWFVRGDYLALQPVPTLGQVGGSALILIFAFVGVEIALTPSGEVLDHARTVPRALFFALCTTTAIYALVQLVAQGLLGPALASSSAAPLAEAAGRVLGRGGRALMLAGATVSMFGYMCGDMLSTPRAFFALARDGFLPAKLATVHPRYRTPHVAIVVYAAAVAVAAISGGFVQLAIIANVAILSLYLLCVTASYELQRRDVRTGGEPFVLPAGPLVPMLAVVVILWLLSHATLREFAFEALALGAAFALNLARRAGARRSARGNG